MLIAQSPRLNFLLCLQGKLVSSNDLLKLELSRFGKPSYCMFSDLLKDHKLDFLFV